MPPRTPSSDSHPVRLTVVAISRLPGVPPDPDRVARVWHDVLDNDLRERVGEQLADSLSESELEEFEQLSQGDDEGAVVAWLAIRIPDYSAIVEAELQTVARLAAQRLVEHATDAREPTAHAEEASRGR